MSLSEELRPKSLDEVLGQDACKRAVKSYAESGKWPSAFLLFGASGTGKTTLAWIIARAVQPEDTYILQVNGSDKNGVDDAREIASESQTVPFNGKPRVFIIDEAHRMSTAAQDCLLIPMETSASVFILCSTDPQKLLPAIKSRCSAATFETRPLDKDGVGSLVARGGILSEKRTEVVEFLWQSKIASPREALGVVDQYLAGVPLDKCVCGVEHEPLYGDIAKAALSGKWTAAAELLKKVPTADSRAMVSVLSSKLRWEALNTTPSPKLDALSACLVGLDQLGYADGVAYGAVTGLIAKVCKALGGAK